MANVTLKRKTDSGWVTMYPQTTIDQISDMSTIGANLAALDNPGVTSFFKIATNGTVTLINAATLISDLQVAEDDHIHAISDVTNLQTTLNNKADLSGGKILSSQIPDFLFSGVRKMSAAAGDSTHDSLEELYALLTGSTDAERKGGYFVASQDFSLTWGAGYVLIGGGDEGDSTSPVTIESGDWIVYAGLDGTSQKQFTIVNNTYRNADTSAEGVVKLSSTSAVIRYDLATSSSSAKIVDEKILRQVMKDVYYGGTPTGVTGDLWFDGTFA